MTTKKAVLGIVATDIQADSIVRELRRGGFPGGDISVLFPDRSGTHDFAHENSTKAPEGAIAGVGAGGVLGGTVGLLAGLGALAIPGLGPFIAAGPIMAALSGAFAGAAVGGLTGALIGLGIPEIEAKVYEGKVRDGSILISVHVETNPEQGQAKKVLERFGATDIVTVGEESVSSRRSRRATG